MQRASCRQSSKIFYQYVLISKIHILQIKSVFSKKKGTSRLVRDIVREYVGYLCSQEAAEEEGGDRAQPDDQSDNVAS